ncbi:MAG: diacylglycerol kinase family protein [Vicingaceae bacterium]|nr:diacylglycerol kinase family protein [Vicingaceae bacterium]
MRRIKSFIHAFNGIKMAFKEEANFRIHVVATIMVIAAGLYFKLSTTEWFAIIIVIGLVLVTELVNTAIENIANFISPERHEKIKTIKDIAAAAVLISAIVALVVGLVVFIPKI